MHKLRLFPLAAALLTASLALPALAQANREASRPARSPADSAQFIDMSEVVIDGQVKKPAILRFDITKRAHFDFLLKLKKPLRDVMLQTAADKNLR